jgi:hypothetical protein
MDNNMMEWGCQNIFAFNIAWKIFWIFSSYIIKCTHTVFWLAHYHIYITTTTTTTTSYHHVPHIIILIRKR